MLLLNVAHEASLGLKLPITSDALKDGSHLLGVAWVRCLLLTAHLLRLGRSLEVVLDLRVLRHDHPLRLVNALLELLLGHHPLLLLEVIFLVRTTTVHLLRLGAASESSSSRIVALVLELLLLLLGTRWSLRGHLLLAGLLHGSLPILGTHILVKVVSSTHRLLLLLLGWVLVGTLALDRSIEVAILKLVILHLSLRVEPFVTFNYMVVCREG